jgi:hypothetical protein
VSAVIAVRRRRIAAVLGSIGLALGVAACGKSNDPSTAENNGVYISAGPVTYQLEISRELNQYSTEDRQYMTGLPAGTSSTLSPGQIWYGVFLWAKNQSHHSQMTSDSFDIVDTELNHYYPVALNPSLNPYAWASQSLAPGAIEPAPDTTASFGPTQGGLLLFKLPISVYDNRPLVLQIKGPTGRVWGSISLDL